MYENKIKLTIEDVSAAASDIADILQSEFRGKTGLKLYGVPRGGIPAAFAVASEYVDATVVSNPADADIIIDDILDSGATSKKHIQDFGLPFYALFNKQCDERWIGRWLVMPWEETDEGVDVSGDDIFVRLLQFVGENPQREGLKDTPARMMRAWREWTSGYGQDPAEILKCFVDGSQNCDELVIVHNIPFISKCEHHLADIVGIAHVGYIPSGRIVGLSKLARLVDCFARRLQVQERATVEIADSLMRHLEPIGAGVLIRASHACMSTRGIKIHGSVTTTSAMRGALMTKGEARKEFMDLCALAERDRKML